MQNAWWSRSERPERTAVVKSPRRAGRPSADRSATAVKVQPSIKLGLSKFLGTGSTWEASRRLSRDRCVGWRRVPFPTILHQLHSILPHPVGSGARRGCGKGQPSLRAARSLLASKYFFLSATYPGWMNSARILSGLASIVVCKSICNFVSMSQR